MSRTLCFFLALGSNIAAFFIFLHPKTYPKISAEPVMRTPDPLLVRSCYENKILDAKQRRVIKNMGIQEKKYR